VESGHTESWRMKEQRRKTQFTKKEPAGGPVVKGKILARGKRQKSLKVMHTHKKLGTWRGGRDAKAQNPPKKKRDSTLLTEQPHLRSGETAFRPSDLGKGKKRGGKKGKRGQNTAERRKIRDQKKKEIRVFMSELKSDRLGKGPGIRAEKERGGDL